MSPHRHRPLRTIALSVFALLAGVGAVSAAKEAANTYKKLDIFTRVLTYVENNYVEEVDEEKLVYGAIKGMLTHLDPHTVFMTPDQYRQMKEETQGEFGGLGIEVALKEGQLVVVAPIDDTPAARAGIKPGDKLLKIDGVPTRDLNLGEAIDKMRGPAGTKVTLTLMREGFTEPRDFVLIRDQIRVKSVEGRLIEKQWGYVRIKSFQDRTDQYLKKQLEEMSRAAGGALRGLVLDLRKNPGGLLDQAVRVADLFLADGVIVSTEGRGRHRIEVEKATLKGTEPNYPMIVLVDSGSASASEIVAGALQDHERAVIMGTQSFGKGSVQTVIEMEDGSGLKLTIARYYTPKHRSIQEKGITPDVVVREQPPTAEEEEGPGERTLKGHLRAEGEGDGGTGEKIDDHQLRTALDYLKTWQMFRAQAGSKGAPPP